MRRSDSQYIPNSQWGSIFVIHHAIAIGASLSSVMCQISTLLDAKFSNLKPCPLRKRFKQHLQQTLSALLWVLSLLGLRYWGAVLLQLCPQLYQISIHRSHNGAGHQPSDKANQGSRSPPKNNGDTVCHPAEGLLRDRHLPHISLLGPIICNA